MKDKHDLTRGWLTKAASDLATADLILDSPGPYDTACFHAQQAIEKLLKAVLAFHELPIPKSHDLEELQRSVCAIQPLPELADLDLAEMTDYAVAVRYDFEFWPDQEMAGQAVTLAQKIQRIILGALPPECHP
ncbi:MAG: HEPN domain-containing protein [Anaerolineae bacterium]